MRVIGTAGHVDHGKSTLVQALTGIHPDRLKEEREREMTIDLGFAWLILPQGEEIGIVDVPGHRDFIENMLAGVGGIDAVLFVIAADEGVMPQTREHLAILDILQVRGGVVALTKIDLVEDKDWLDLVEEDIRSVLRGTVLGEAPILRVSARTLAGIPELLQALADCLAEQPPRPDLGRPRLPVDRVFTIAGFGTVVTGTLTDGAFRVGDEIQVYGGSQQNLRGRIRGLQTHKKKEDLAVPGSRTAINISGLNVDEIQRGDVIAHPGDYRLTRRLDVRFRLLPDISQPLKHNTETKLFLGAAEVQARLRLLGIEELLPGAEAWLQLELVEPVVGVRGDRYILRRPSPSETLGGGVIVDPLPKGRHKRFDAALMGRLNALMQGTPTDVLFQALQALGAASLQDVITRSNLDETAVHPALRELIASGQLLILEGELQASGLPPRNALVASNGTWTQWISRAVHEVDSYHHAYLLRRGIPKEELKSRLRLPPRLFNAALRKWINEATLRENGLFIQMPGFQIQFNPAQQAVIDHLLARFAASPYAPPTAKECLAEVGEDVFNALVDLNFLVVLTSDVVFRSEDYNRMVVELRQLIERDGAVTAAQVRDYFNTSRRYVLAFLEYLDSQGVTVRDGDVRRLRR